MIDRLDSNISKLVEILNKMDFETIKSCEGHVGSDFHCSYPWIAFYNNSRIDYLKKIIREYNRNQLKEEWWEIGLSGKIDNQKIIYILKPEQSYKNIYFLHKQVLKLVKYFEKTNIKSCF